MSKLENRLATIRVWTALPEEKRKDMIEKNRTRAAETWASGVLSSIILELRGVKARGKRGSKVYGFAMSHFSSQATKSAN